MTRHLIIAALLATGAGACAEQDTRPRYTSTEEHFSVHELTNWTTGRDRGTTTFRSPDGSVVIAVRAVPFEGDWAEPRTAKVMIPATEKVLRGLPNAIVGPPREVRGASMRAQEFELTFTTAAEDKKFWRRHVVMFGSEQVFHVMVTAAPGAMDATEAKAFEQVLSSLREEA